jgi:hypothetical protein
MLTQKSEQNKNILHSRLGSLNFLTAFGFYHSVDGRAAPAC